MTFLRFNNSVTRGNAAWWRAVTAAVVVLHAAGCRVRHIDNSERGDTTLSPEAIHSPDNVAVLPALLSGHAEARAEPERKSVPPAAVLVLGFGDVDFARVRQAQKEGEALLDAVSEAHEPWPALDAPLSDIARRRWASRDEPQRSAGVDIFDSGRIVINRRANENLLHAALTALGHSPRTVTRRDTPLNYDWAPLRGPIVALVRARSGKMAITWQHAAAPGELHLAEVLTANGALAVLCDCEDAASPRRAANELASLFEHPNQFGRRARELAEQLQAESQDPIDYAVVALTDHGVTVEGNEALVYGTAGSATIRGVANEPDDEPSTELDEGASDASPTDGTAAVDGNELPLPTPSTASQSGGDPLQSGPTPESVPQQDPSTDQGNSTPLESGPSVVRPAGDEPESPPARSGNETPAPDPGAGNDSAPPPASKSQSRPLDESTSNQQTPPERAPAVAPLPSQTTPQSEDHSEVKRAEFDRRDNSTAAPRGTQARPVEPRATQHAPPPNPRPLPSTRPEAHP